MAHDVATVDVTATLADAKASMTIDGNAQASGEAKTVTLLLAGKKTKIEIEVTAEDGTTTKYTITVNRAKKPTAELTSLTQEGLVADFEPGFAPGVYEYSIAATYDEDAITLTATTDLDGANIEYKHTKKGTVMEEKFDLLVGNNIITITVKKDGYKKTTYTITVTRASLPVHNASTGEHYATIQEAINAADPNDTILVAAGTYDSSIETFPININKSLTLLGAQANVDPRPSQGGRIGSESIIDADETNSAVLRIISASDVEINGFTITGGTGDMVEESGHANNLLFRYNILYDDLASTGDEAIQIKYSDGVVMEYNYAYNIVQDAFNLSASTNGVVSHNEAHDIYSENAAIYCYDATNIDIIGNLVYDVPNNDGIKLGDSGDDSTGGIVKDNEVHDAAEDGITIYASGVTVENNTIYNCDSENGALYLYGADNTTVKGNKIHNNAAIGLLICKSLNVEVMSNNIYNNDDSDDTKYTGSAGIWLTSIEYGGFGGTGANTININYNNIYGNADFGLKNEYSDIVDAENNWWGYTTGPDDDSDDTGTGGLYNPNGQGDAVSDNVDYEDWLPSEYLVPN